MKNIIIIICSFFVGYFSFFVVNVLTLGISNSKDVAESITYNKLLGVDYINTNIIIVGDMPFISKTLLSNIMPAKYYIDEVGLVFRFTEASRMIDDIYIENTKILPKTDRQKLGLDKN